MSRFTDGPNISGIDPLDQRVRRVEDDLQVLENRLPSTYIKGRLRTDRNAPTSSTDIQTPDRLYDIVRDNNYEYVLINLGGSLSWMRSSYSTF